MADYSDYSDDFSRTFISQHISRKDYENLELVVAVLVKQLGGSVIIHAHEMEAAVDLKLFATKQDSPPMFILEVKEPVK